jgi:hypothetical protein
MPMTFIAGGASDVFDASFARSVEKELRASFPSLQFGDGGDAYRSEEVDATGWTSLQGRVAAAVAHSVQVARDPYQVVYLPLTFATIAPIAVPPAADPIQAASLPALLDELNAFAAKSGLPTDDLELMQLGAKYLEDDALFHRDLDVQTYVQLMLSAKQAAAHGRALWIAIT